MKSKLVNPYDVLLHLTGYLVFEINLICQISTTLFTTKYTVTLALWASISKTIKSDSKINLVSLSFSVASIFE